MEGRLVQEKVEMLRRHTEVGLKMQEMGMKYLEDHKDDLKVPNAVRLLIDGLMTERTSRGIPQMLEKMVNRTDEELLKELQDIVTKAPVTIERLDE
jgi:flagellar motor component MotA